MGLVTTIKPSVEPWTLVEARLACRIDDQVEDTFLQDVIVAARTGAETYLRRRLVTQTVELTLNGFPQSISLPICPVQSIASISYTDDAGDPQTLAASDYQLVTSSLPNFIAPAYGLSWPTTRLDFDTVVVTLKVGYGDAAINVPFDIRQAILLKIAHYFENRSATSSDSVSEIPYGISDSLKPYIFWI